MSRILIADDDDELRQLLQSVLTVAGHEVRQTRDGLEALAILQAEPMDVAILDIYMPVMDGIETIIAARRRFPKVKLIAITGNAPKTGGSILSMAEKLGAHLILAKPFTVEQILEAVARLTNGSIHPEV